ncbi:hypothetical protein [Streptomyces sp. NPDC007346]|uniref:hypothetical protein n=1 Tax=Streptomyces sp. NPDC007346 TaxID=3154682 RepID=UPI003453AC84
MHRNTAPSAQELATILTLLRQGLPNAEVHRRTFIGKRTIARIRQEAGIPPVPHTAFRRPPHPRAVEIQELLKDGHTNSEVRRRTGADLRTIARHRRELEVGPATIVKSPRENWVHPKDAEVRALLAQMSNARIADTLGVDRAAVSRIRKLAGIEWAGGPQFATVEELWATLVRPVDGGHLEWLGPRSSASRTPILRLRGKSASPAGIAFRKRTGRDPVGQVRAECGFRHCVDPAHVDDEPGRRRVREQVRAVRGLGPPPAFCRHGHDQAEHGKFEQDGEAYCEACKRDQKRTAENTTSTEGATT